MVNASLKYRRNRDVHRWETIARRIDARFDPVAAHGRIANKNDEQNITLA